MENTECGLELKLTCALNRKHTLQIILHLPEPLRPSPTSSRDTEFPPRNYIFECMD